MCDSKRAVLNILIPGFMATPVKDTGGLIGFGYKDWNDKYNFDPLNKELFRFWTSWGLNKTYDEYLSLCNKTCKTICKNNKSMDIRLIGHSTGCTVILDNNFALNKLKNVTEIELLSPAVFSYMTGTPFVVGDFPFNKWTWGMTHILMKYALFFVMTPKFAVVPPFMFPYSGGTVRALFDPQWVEIAMPFWNVCTYMLKFCDISTNYNEGVFDRNKYKLKIATAHSDGIVDVKRLKAWLPKSARNNIKVIHGDHESPLIKYLEK